MTTNTERLKLAIQRAELGQSKLDPPQLFNYGMSSPKVKHLLNNLVIESTRYMEIGVFTGSTFIGAMYKNNPEFQVCIDNFCEYPTSREEFKANCARWLTFPPNLIDQDSFTVDPKLISGINVYFYDGNHDEPSQAKALTHFLPSLADEFIFLVDDYLADHVVAGTQRGIREAGLKIEFEQNLPARFKPDIEQWWCGLYAAVLRK